MRSVGFTPGFPFHNPFAPGGSGDLVVTHALSYRIAGLGRIRNQQAVSRAGMQKKP